MLVSQMVHNLSKFSVGFWCKTVTWGGGDVGEEKSIKKQRGNTLANCALLPLALLPF